MSATPGIEMGKRAVILRIVQGLLIGAGFAFAQVDDAPQLEVHARMSVRFLGGVGGGGGGLGGISELLSKSNSGAMVNEFTGQPAFPISLGSISAQNGLSYSLGVSYYGGGMDELAKANPMYLPGSWVGAGFSLKSPFVQVQGEDITFSKQKYFLSLDGHSQQEMIQVGTSDNFVLKNNPYVRIHRVSGIRTNILRDRCPNQANQQFSFTIPYIAYWTVTLADGTQYVFGDQAADCDAAESELCQPQVGSIFKYNPFYTLEQDSKSAVTYFVTSMKDRQGHSAIWFRYDKVQENLVESCNEVNTTPTFTTAMDRAIYLKEIYATNGTQAGNFQTSKITFTSVPKTEEPVIAPSLAYPAAFHENRKLAAIDFFEKGSSVGKYDLNYSTREGRMVLENIEARNPFLAAAKNFLSISYVPGTLRIERIRDAQDRLVEYGYGYVEAAPINGSGFSPDFQIMEPSSFPANTRIALSRQVGNNFYVATENWSQGCLESPIPEIFREKIYEYEFNGTYWNLKRVIDAPTLRCPTAMDAFLSPDGKYFVWSYSQGGNRTELDVVDLTSEANPPPISAFYYDDVAGFSQRTNVYVYSDWFAVHNPEFKNNVSFYWKNASGAWTSTCPADIAPSTYDRPPATSPRSNNYSGDAEGVNPSSCLTFGSPIEVTPGPDFLVVVNQTLEILHVFANNNGIKDYVKGLETTTPVLPNFTLAQVGNPTLQALARPWFRRTNTDGQYHNNWERNILNVTVSENLILVESETGVSDWQYLYVLGWDGNQLRYLYDEPLATTTQAPPPASWGEPFDFAAGPDYFILKNSHAAGGRSGFFHYKVDLKTWRVVPPVSNPWPPATLLPSVLFNMNGEDWAIKAYPDLIFLEKMNNLSGGSSHNPALVTLGNNTGSTDVGGIFYRSLDQTSAFLLDANRNPVDITSNFTINPGPNQYTANNFSVQGDRILSVETHRTHTSPNPVVTTRYLSWKRNADPGATVPWDLYPMLDPFPATSTDRYHSSRLVTGGVITTRFTKNQTAESLSEINFFPDRFHLVPKPGDPSQNVQGGVVVNSVSVLTKGEASTGNAIQTLTLSYPGASPDAATDGAILKNYQTGTPNFKYVRKDFSEGAQVTGFLRDELFNKVAAKDNPMIGSMATGWNLPDKTSYKKPGGAAITSLSRTTSISGKPSQSFAVEPLEDASKSFFHNAHLSSLVNKTAYDSKNGQPKITVSRTGGKFLVTLAQYQQDLDPSFEGPFNLLRQSSKFQFDLDPCSRIAGGDPCGNLSQAWFTSARMPNIVSSTIMTYDSFHRTKEIFQWRPDALGSVYPALDGNPAGTGTGWKWVSILTNTRWQDHAVARCKSDMVTESKSMDVFSVSFIGGPDCEVLGSVSNSPLSTAALLTGEEDILTQNCEAGPCLGAFGRWESGGSATLQGKVVHSGNHSFSVTGLFGPTINLKLREMAGFMDHKRGFLVSAWILATASSNPAFIVEFRPGAGGAPVYLIDVTQEYVAAKGNIPIGKWVKLERLIPYEELAGHGLFTSTPSTDFLRIWIGKGASTTTNAVYVDDVRLHPADAVVSSRNVDVTGLTTSILNSENEPAFMEYDVWRNRTAIRKKDGMVSSSAAIKLLNE